MTGKASKSKKDYERTRPQKPLTPTSPLGFIDVGCSVLSAKEEIIVTFTEQAL